MDHVELELMTEAFDDEALLHSVSVNVLQLNPFSPQGTCRRQCHFLRKGDLTKDPHITYESRSLIITN